ncbi:hypothetical protein V7728_16210 [Bacillus sp. JHAA]|nr:hypothetical protein [Bacillus velezensis]MDR0143290.1 hypothetical protein [Bacillus velezensis]MEC1370263.1 hypothetical protein [Bacillus velezensis]MEC1566920.1 hypothetical protein [Bacillus velezensis]MEC2148770.1 hypothetical protein [Bacillus velezensis]
MDKYSNFKLKIDAKPSLFHGRTVRKAVGQSLWYRIRDHILQKDTPVCSICGFSPQPDEMRNLHLHEIEDYDFENIVVTLSGLNLICANCHAFHHFGFTQLYSSKEKMERLIEHFAKVNECEINDFKDYRRSLLFRLQPEAETKKTKTNLSFQDIKAGNYTVRYAIIGDIPFKDEVIDKLNKKGVYYQYK